MFSDKKHNDHMIKAHKVWRDLALFLRRSIIYKKDDTYDDKNSKIRQYVADMEN